jgi:hypothetical protein
MTVAIAALLAAARPAIADGPGPVTPPASAVPTSSGSRAIAPRAGVALLIVGGVLGVVSSFLLVRAHQERNDLNSDESLADGAYGTLMALPALASLTVGAFLLIPSDASSNSNSPNNLNSHPRFVQLPRGLTMRFRF